MASSQGASDYDSEWFTFDSEAEGAGDGMKVIAIHRPFAGLYDLGNPLIPPPHSASLAKNVTFETLEIQKAPGRRPVGNQITSPMCWWGYQHIVTSIAFGSPPVMGSRTELRVNGPHLWRLDETNPNPDQWVWVGAVSGMDPPTSADLIGNETYLGTAVQKAHRIFYADGGERRRVFVPGTPNKIIDWGADIIVPPPVITAETGTGGGLLTGRRYSFKAQLISDITGFKSPLSEPSNVWLITNPGDDSTLTVTVGPVPGWTAEYSIIRLGRSPGAVDPSIPAEWKFDQDATGVTNLNSAPHTFTSSQPDGNLGSELKTVFGKVPRMQYVLYDPSGDRCIGLGNPEDPNVMYWSDDGDFGNWDPNNQTPPIDDNEGDPVSGGYSHMGRIYIFKRYRGIYSAVQNSLGAYDVELITNAVGCVSHHSIVCRGGFIYWAGTEGFFEFSGQTPVNISDDRIRKLMIRLASSDKYPVIYGIERRKPGSVTLQWQTTDPADGQTYRLIFDLNLRAWTVLGPEGPFGDDAVGPTVLWSHYDAINIDMATSDQQTIYGADGSGNAYRLDTDYDGTPLYAFLGEDYRMDFRTNWFGDGISETYIPRYFKFLLANVEGFDTGKLRVSFYVNGETTESAGQDYDLPGGISQAYAWHMYHVPSHFSPCRMFSFGAEHHEAGGAPRIPRYAVLFSKAAPRLR